MLELCMILSAVIVPESIYRRLSSSAWRRGASVCTEKEDIASLSIVSSVVPGESSF